MQCFEALKSRSVLTKSLETTTEISFSGRVAYTQLVRVRGTQDRGITEHKTWSEEDKCATRREMAAVAGS